MFKDSPFYKILEPLSHTVECKGKIISSVRISLRFWHERSSRTNQGQRGIESYSKPKCSYKVTTDRLYSSDGLLRGRHWSQPVYQVRHSIPSSGGTQGKSWWSQSKPEGLEEQTRNYPPCRHNRSHTKESRVPEPSCHDLCAYPKGKHFNPSLAYFLLTDPQKYFVLVNLVQRYPIEDLVAELKARKTISKEQVVRESMIPFTQPYWMCNVSNFVIVRNRAEDTDIVATSSVMSLKCPLSTLRIEVPCRSVVCTHNQCFDASSFLQLQEQAPTWTCPVCSKATSFESLQIDQ